METSNVTISMTEKDNDITIMFDFSSEELDFEDFIDACRRAAYAFGFPERLVARRFEPVDTENDW